ncbi:hypothetical protein [Micromonospora eburnea]|uniref:Nitrite reductase (NO-forming) n=1 Tax=Micromonospora eburnea TaxID=227316 RepID=A0A1C6UWT4_9ACTN|nr:hypothetical protein [Micromonospora eburnea]SCL58552.1 hypothetical protein GA0070604_3859 [Micromonospora eburnea]
MDLLSPTPRTPDADPPPDAGRAPSSPAAGAAPARAAGRSAWHRRAGLLPLGYLAGLVGLGLAHPFLPTWRWLAIHLLLLGAVTNAIVIWSAHFSTALLRTPPPGRRRGEALRLAALNVGVLAVLTGGAGDRPWLGVSGAALVFAALVWHLAWLAGQLRRALPSRFRVTVHYYLVAGLALLTGVPVGAGMLVSDGTHQARLLLFHAHVNLLGWITLTVLGTLLTFWPTMLRIRMADTAVRDAVRALPLATIGLVLLGVGLLTWWRVVTAVGLALFVLGVLVAVRPAVAVARARPPYAFASWSLAAAAGWLLVALAVDAATLLPAADPTTAVDRFGVVLVPLLVGFVGQVLIGSLSHLLPVVLGGGPAPARARAALLDRHGAQRVAMTNAALVVFALPSPPYVRITTSLLILAALVQFLVPAARVLLTTRR